MAGASHLWHFLEDLVEQRPFPRSTLQCSDYIFPLQEQEMGLDPERS